jgi:hypothetical protein
MNVTWNIEGADWAHEIIAPIDSIPIDICTQAIESLIKKKSKEISFGLVMIVHHELMKSENEYFVCYTPLALANAGYHDIAKKIQQSLDNALKK